MAYGLGASQEPSERQQKKKRGRCPRGTVGCDFTEWDHKMMDFHAETCADWLRKRREAHAVKSYKKEPEQVADPFEDPFESPPEEAVWL